MYLDMPPETFQQISTALLGVMLGLWVVERFVMMIVWRTDREPAEDRQARAIDDLYPTWSTILKHAYLRWKGLPLPDLQQAADKPV